MHNPLNFRDMGGSAIPGNGRVKTGMLYRSGSLDRVRGRHLRLVLDAGLKTVIDLRPSGERPARVTELRGVRRLAVPFDIDRFARKRLLPFLNKRDGGRRLIDEIAAVYRDVITLTAPSVPALFDRIIDAEYPLCINCRAGKDRTGYAAALVLRTLGVADHDIMRDYLATNSFLLPRVQRITRPLRLLSFGLLPTRTWEAAITAHESSLRAALDAIDREHGGTGAYLDFCGVPEGQRTRLREQLCEFPGS